MERLNGYYGDLVMLSEERRAIGSRVEQVRVTETHTQPGIVMREASEAEAIAWCEYVTGLPVTAADLSRVRAMKPYIYAISTD